MARDYHQGRFVPTNPSRYEGNPSGIIFRSSWEKRVMVMFDTHPSIVKWSSEEVVIPYLWEADGKMHRYFPDFKATMKTNSGIKNVLIEVKPYAQTLEPKQTKGKRKKTFVNEVLTYSKNDCKWKAAQQFCLDRGWQFIILTEKDIFKGKVW